MTSFFALIVFLGCQPQLARINTPQYQLNTAVAQLTEDQMAEAIRHGSIASGWSIVTESPRLITAKIVAGGHSATVEIPYDARNYTIKHKESSPGLGYQVDDLHYRTTVIHHRYNFWVDRLDQNIKQEIEQIMHRRSTVPPREPVETSSAQSIDAGAVSTPESVDAGLPK